MLQSPVRRAAWLIACVLAAAAASPSGAGAEAVTYQQDAGHTGFAAGASAPPPLGKRWVRTDLGEALGYPLIAEGKIFVSNVGFAGGRSVYALDRRTGSILWSRPIWTSSLSYSEGRLFTVNSEGIVQALSAATGATVWTVSLQYAKAAVPAGDMLYVAGGGGRVSAIRQADGLIVWNGSAANDEDLPTVDADRVYVTSHCPTTALSRLAGARLWSHQPSCTGSRRGVSAVYGGRVYAPAGGAGVVLDALTGSLLDTFPGILPAFAGEVGLFPTDTTLVARRLADGVTLWSYRPPAEAGSPNGSPLIVGGVVYLVTNNGRLYGIDLASGRQLWEGDMRTSRSDSGSYRPSGGTGIAAVDNEVVVTTPNKILAYTPGSDTPGVDVDPKRSSEGWKLTAAIYRRNMVFGALNTVTSSLTNASGSYGSGKLELQVDPYPFDGGWQTAAVEHDSTISSHEFRVRPDRNVRYRVVYDTTEPPLLTVPRTVYVDLDFRVRYHGYAPGPLTALISVRGPRDAPLARRPVSLYRVRQGGRVARRIARGRLRLVRPGRARATLRFFFPHSTARDLVFPCLLERRPDAWGRTYSYERRCGRRILT